MAPLALAQESPAIAKLGKQPTGQTIFTALGIRYRVVEVSMGRTIPDRRAVYPERDKDPANADG